MSRYEDKPATVYEITWNSGHIERIKAHQIAWPNNYRNLFGGGEERPQRVEMHAEIDGVWTLQLSALVDDIRTIRNTATEFIAAPEA